jgi:hypothetical protein
VDSLDNKLKTASEDNVTRWIPLVVAGLGSAVTIALSIWLGSKSFSEIPQRVQERINTEISKSFKRLDPTSAIIYVPVESDPKLDKSITQATQILKLNGFKFIYTYQPATRLPDKGVVIRCVSNTESEKELQTLLGTSHLDPTSVGYVIYTAGNYRVNIDALADRIPNIRTSNMSTTIPDAVFDVARALQ